MKTAQWEEKYFPMATWLQLIDCQLFFTIITI